MKVDVAPCTTTFCPSRNPLFLAHFYINRSKLNCTSRHGKFDFVRFGVTISDPVSRCYPTNFCPYTTPAPATSSRSAPSSFAGCRLVAPSEVPLFRGVESRARSRSRSFPSRWANQRAPYASCASCASSEGKIARCVRVSGILVDRPATITKRRDL